MLLFLVCILFVSGLEMADSLQRLQFTERLLRLLNLLLGILHRSLFVNLLQLVQTARRNDWLGRVGVRLLLISS